MKTSTLFLALVGASLAFSGCAPEVELEQCMGSCTTVVGRLMTANGQHPISNADVAVEWHYGSASWPKAKTKTQGRTDANGNYNLSFFIKDEELTEGFFVVEYIVDKNKYYTIGQNEQVALNDAKRDTTLEVADYVIPRKAYVRLVVTNPTDLPPYPAYVYTSSFNTLYGLNNRFSSQIQGGGSVIMWNGLPTESQKLPIAGDQPVLVRNYKVKNGVTTRSTDSIFVAAGSTYTYTGTY